MATSTWLGRQSKQEKSKKVIFIVSPQNPFKRDVDLLPEQQRLGLVSAVLS
jgi:nicotinic acid mononucleotide adenylyltransferase